MFGLVGFLKQDALRRVWVFDRHANELRVSDSFERSEFDKSTIK